MSDPAHLGDALSMYTRMFPDKIAARDLERAMTFRVWNERARRLANAFTGIGLVRGDRVCVLAYNCLEWAEIYAATAIAGLIVVPINFRLVGQEITYIFEDCGASALIVQDELINAIESVPVLPEHCIVFGDMRGPDFWLPHLRRPNCECE
jgi:acyl-CoA synthetase (AMP-forming)/AMP-acid ligase II